MTGAQARGGTGTQVFRAGVAAGLCLVFASCAQPPVIDGITADPNPVAPDAQALIHAAAHSPQGENLLYHWTIVETGSGRLLQPTGNPVVYEAPKLTGDYHVALRVLDAHSRPADDTLLIEVRTPGLWPDRGHAFAVGAWLSRR